MSAIYLLFFVPDYREVPLMLLHNRNEHRFRKGEIDGVKFTPHRGRSFDQVGDLVQQRWVVRYDPADLSCQVPELLLDGSAPLVQVHQDVLSSQSGEVVGGCLDSDRWGAGRPRSPTNPSTAHARVLEGDHIVAQQAD